MNLKLLKGYVLLLLSVIVLAAAVVLLTMNLGDQWELHVYAKKVTLSRALYLLLAAVGGVLLWWILRKALPAGITNLREGTALRRGRQTEKRLKNLEKKKP